MGSSSLLADTQSQFLQIETSLGNLLLICIPCKPCRLLAVINASRGLVYEGPNLV
jgi:hypothetical protein